MGSYFGYFLINLSICVVLFFLWKFLIRPWTKQYRRIFFAWVYPIINNGPIMTVQSPLRKKLLDDLHKRTKEIGKPLKILEIGVGFGSNFQFFPEGSNVVCIDPNPNWLKCFPDYAKKSPHVNIADMVVAYGEDMPMVKDETVDAVVATLVLCSVTDVDKCISEAKRVLKPGGRFYFFEHVQADKKVGGSLLWTVQKLIKYTWAFVFDDCLTDRALWKNLESAGFSEIQIERFVFDWGSAICYPISAITIGHLTK